MITTSAFVFATVALSAVSSFGAPIKVRRDGSEVQQIGRRFPQTVAADSPVLVKKEVETPIADTVVRRFPRRVYYEHYNKRETPDVFERSPAPESAPEARSIADEASDDLAARKRRRGMRRSTDSVHFKRILQRDGVRARREEPKMKRSVVSQPVVAREPEPKPAPAKENRAFIPPLEKRDSMIPAPVIESRAFIPPAPAAVVAARDTFVWTINAGGVKVEQITDVKQTQKINGLPPSGSDSPSSVESTPTSTDSSATPTSTDSSTESQPTGTTTGGSPTQTPPCMENPPATGGTGTGKGEEGSSSSTPASTSTSPSSTSSGTATASGSKPTSSSTPSGNPAESTNPNSGTSSNSQKPPSQKPPVMNTVPQNNPPDTNAKRDEEPSSPVMPRGSPKWRRIVPAPSLNRRSKSASSVVQFKR